MDDAPCALKDNRPLVFYENSTWDGVIWAPKSAEAHWKNLGIEDQSLLFQKYTLAADGDEAMCEKMLSKEECGAGSSCMWNGESNKCEQYEGSYDDMLNKYYGINRDDKG